MILRKIAPLALCLMLLCAPALAAKTPACEQLGAQKAAEHLSTHIYAYTCYWDGETPSDCTDEVVTRSSIELVPTFTILTSRLESAHNASRSASCIEAP